MPDFKKALQELRDARAKEAASLPSNFVNDPSAPFAGARSAPRDGELMSVKSARSVEQELEGEEWIKKSELAAFGRFNIIGANKRMTTFKNRHFEQTNFMVQLLDGPYRGATAWCSFESNVVRDKIYRLVGQYGGVGPFTLEKREDTSSDRQGAYVFVAEDDESAANATAMHVGVDGDDDEMTGNSVEETDHLPFDAVPDTTPVQRRKKR